MKNVKIFHIGVCFFGLYLIEISLLLFVHTCSSALCSYLLLSVALHLNQLHCLQKKEEILLSIDMKKKKKDILYPHIVLIRNFYS